MTHDGAARDCGSEDRGLEDWAVEISDTVLTLHRDLVDLPEPLRGALTRWFGEHGVDPSRLALGTPVTRHEESSSLSWYEDRDHDRVVHHVFPAVGLDDRWPAPFPGRRPTR